MHKFRFTVLTEESNAFDDLVNRVIVNTSEGEITVLKNHIPLITTVNRGRLIIMKDNYELKYEINDGVLKINREETILMSNRIIKK